ncbi:MAG TPA: MFS transporter [Actinomycetota bacterium]|jgi:MFS family permease
MAGARDGGRGTGHRGWALLRLLGHHQFRLLWTGMTVSLVGDGVFLVALAWQVYALSNVPTALSAVMLAMSVPHVLLLLVGGVVSDRFDRRRVMLAADLVRGAALLALAVLSLSGGMAVWSVAALAVLYGAGTAFFGPAFDAIVPEIVPTDLLVEANSLDQFVRPTALRLAGPALGGAVVAAVGPGWAFALDAATFAVSVWVLLLMVSGGRSDGTVGGPDDQGQPGGSAFGEMLEGFRFVRRHVWLWGTFLSATIAYLLFLGPSEVLLAFVVKNDLGGGAGDLGIVYAMGGLGAIAAAALMAWRGEVRRFMTFIFVSWAAATFAVAGYGLATSRWHLVVAAFWFNALETAGTVVWATAKHRLVPLGLLGRVASFDWFISIALLPLSYGLTGPVAGVLGARTTLVAAGLLGGAVTLAFLFLPGMRAVERHPPGALAPLDPAPPLVDVLSGGTGRRPDSAPQARVHSEPDR